MPPPTTPRSVVPKNRPVAEAYQHDSETVGRQGTTSRSNNAHVAVSGPTNNKYNQMSLNKRIVSSSPNTNIHQHQKFPSQNQVHTSPQELQPNSQNQTPQSHPHQFQQQRNIQKNQSYMTSTSSHTPHAPTQELAMQQDLAQQKASQPNSMTPSSQILLNSNSKFNLEQRHTIQQQQYAIQPQVDLQQHAAIPGHQAAQVAPTIGDQFNVSGYSQNKFNNPNQVDGRSNFGNNTNPQGNWQNILKVNDQVELFGLKNANALQFNGERGFVLELNSKHTECAADQMLVTIQMLDGEKKIIEKTQIRKVDDDESNQMQQRQQTMMASQESNKVGNFQPMNLETKFPDAPWAKLNKKNKGIYFLIQEF